MFRNYLQSCQLVPPDECHVRFIDDAEEWHNVLIFRLRDKLRDDPDIIQHAFSICDAHDAEEEVDFT
jgi:hypothetical protein